MPSPLPSSCRASALQQHLLAFLLCCTSRCCTSTHSVQSFPAASSAYSLSVSALKSGGFELWLLKASHPVVSWLFSSVSAREIWLDTEEAFGSFHFSESSRSTWTGARVDNLTTAAGPDRKGPHAVLSGEFDIWAQRGLPGLRHLVDVPFNITFWCEEESQQIGSGSAFFPTVHSKIQLQIPGEELSAPVLGWASKGTTSYMLNMKTRAVQVKLGGIQVKLHQAGARCTGQAACQMAPGSHEHILGLGPQYSYTDLVDKGEIRMFPAEQGVGRGKQPLTYFGNVFYPYAGGDAFSSYSSVNAFVSTGGYGVISTSAELGSWTFGSGKTSDGGVSMTQKLTFVKDIYNESTGHAGREFELLLFGAEKLENGTAVGSSLAARVGVELKNVLKRVLQDPRSPDYAPPPVATEDEDHPLDLRGAATAPTWPDYETPSWAGNGALISAEGGTKIVDEKLERVYQAGIPLAGAWIQDWSGLVSTSFAKRVVWDWRLSRTQYPGWEAFVAKWRKRGVRMLTYINPYLSRAHISATTPSGPSSPAADDSGVNFGGAGHLSERPLFDEARDLGYLVMVNMNSSRPLVLPSATDDFRFGILDLSRADVRDWFSDVIICNVMMVHYPKRCPENNSTEPLVWGWMADFGEYLPLAWESNRTRARTDGLFDVAAHGRYPEQWALVNRIVLEKYRGLSKRKQKDAEEELDATRTSKDSTSVSTASDGTSETTLLTKASVNSSMEKGLHASAEGEALLPFFRSASLLSSSILNSFWMGDQLVSFDACDGLQSAFVGHLNAGFSGHKHMHSDVGGYTMSEAHRLDLGPVGVTFIPPYHRSRELLIRWMQYSAFAESVFRTHVGTLPNSSAQVWDEDVIDFLKAYASVFKAGRRYRDAVRKAEPELPLLRHGFMVVGGEVWWQRAPTDARPDEDARDRAGAFEGASLEDVVEAQQARTPTTASTAGKKFASIWRDDCESGKGVLVGENQFFLGPELIVAPVFRANQRQKSVWLPSGTEWRQVFTNATFTGTNSFVLVSASLELIPAFYRVDEGAQYKHLLAASYGGLRLDKLAGESDAERAIYV